MITIRDFWLKVRSLLECTLKVWFDQHEYVPSRKIALDFFFYFLYCQHFQVTIVVCALKCQATELLFLTLPENRFNISTPPFRGCMKNVKTPTRASIVFAESFGVSKKCSADWKVTNKFPQKLLMEFTDYDLSINPGPLCFAQI